MRKRASPRACPPSRVNGKVIAGFKHHLSYFPHSGSVIPELGAELSSYERSKGTVQFAVDQPLSEDLVRELIAIRLRQAFSDSAI